MSESEARQQARGELDLGGERDVPCAGRVEDRLIQSDPGRDDEEVAASKEALGVPGSQIEKEGHDRQERRTQRNYQWPRFAHRQYAAVRRSPHR